jgi:hypothetical protein
MIVDGESSLKAATGAIEKMTENRAAAELTICRFSRDGASQSHENKRL